MRSAGAEKNHIHGALNQYRELRLGKRKLGVERGTEGEMRSIRVE